MLGRDVTLKINGNVVAKVRTKNPSLNRTPVDVTDDDSSGFRELLATPGQKELNISIAGVTKNNLFRELAYNGVSLVTASLTYPDGGVLSGTFFFASYSETVQYQEAVAFEGELQSSGPFTYTPP